MKLPSLRLGRVLPAFIALMLPLWLPCRVFAQSCPSSGTTARMQLPTFSSNVGGLSTAGGTRYIYAMTQYGIARASLSNPAAPSNPTLGQVGLKFSNGGIVPMPCDCWSMGQSFGVAEAQDGTARILMDNLSSHQGGGLPAQVVEANGNGSLGFGQQVNGNLPRPGSQIAAIALPSGRFVGYLPPDEQNVSIQVLDLTSVNSDPDPSSALRPFATALNWGGSTNVVQLQAVNAQGTLLLFGALAGENTLRVARIDPTTGVPSALPASVSVSGGFSGFSVAAVDGRTFVFVSEYGVGLHIFEYTGTGFVTAALIPGSFRGIVVRGTQFPVVFVIRSGGNQNFVDLYGTKFLTQGGSAPTSPAFSLPQGQFLGDSIEAVVTTTGSSSTAYLYRLATHTGSETEVVISTTPINVSCLSADTTSPPTASATFTNLSAAARTGVEATTNYYGDVVKFSDASSTGQPITRVDWDVLTPGSPTFSADAAVGNGLTVQGVYPCDAASGSWNSPNCAASAFPGGAPATASVVFAEKSTNVNGQSQNIFFSTPIPFKKPQVQINGFDAQGFLHVLSGGRADATATQGNTPSLSWVFSPGGQQLSGLIVDVPSNAATFTVTGLWPGGYSNSLQGNIIQTDLVPAFTMSPNPIGLGGTLTLVNRMQIAPAATLTSADVNLAPGTCGAVAPGTYTPLGAAFNAVGGSAPTTVPTTQGGYCVFVRFNYTGSQGPTSQTTSQQLSISPTLAPLQCTPASFNVGGTATCTTSGGSGSYKWNWGEPFQPFVDGPAQNSHQYNSSGNFTITVQDASQPNTYVQANINVTGIVQPPPPPPPPPPAAGITVAISGPASGSPNSPLVFSASTSGGTGSLSYGWACDFNSLGGSGQFVPGNSSVTCSYASQGVHAVGVRVTDSANATATNATSVNITGPGLPSTVFTATGASVVSGNTYQVSSGQEIVFTSSETSANSWGWDFGDNTLGSGRSVRKTYATRGTYTGRLIITGNGVGSAGMAIGTFTIQVSTPAPSGAFTISGANPNSAGTVYTAGVGQEITMTSTETHAQTWGWDFGDQTFGGASSVKKTYTTVGTYTLQLIVTGDGISTTGTTISRFTINVVPCVSNGTTVCLNSNRFRATVAWAVPDQQKAGSGAAVPLTGDTGYFWFFTPGNIEVVLKVVDGRAVNGKFWVFYGALSDVQYTITIEDSATGVVKRYTNPYHTTASLSDTGAFDGGGVPATSKIVEATASGPSLACSPATVTVNNPVTCSVTGAAQGASFRWAWDFCLGGCLVDGSNPQSHSYTTPGIQSVTCVVTEGANTTALTASVNVTAAPAGGLSAAISGPASGTTSDTLTFSANATSGTAPYSYFWACDYGVSTTFSAGGVSTTCSYATTGTHTVGLKVTDSAASPAQFIATWNVAISAPAGPGLPSAAFSLDGATLNAATGRYEAEVGKAITFTAAEPNANLYGWAFGDGLSGSGKTVTHTYAQGGTVNGQLVVSGDGTHTVGTSLASIPLSVLPCAADGKTLCLNGGRFRVRVDWKSQNESGFGTVVPLTSDTGEFWFLTANNIELVIKVVDGTALNGHFWVFYGALSNLEYTITVTDTTTGAVKTYHNPLGTTASVADVNAF